jgi:hypothetical protein
MPKHRVLQVRHDTLGRNNVASFWTHSVRNAPCVYGIPFLPSDANLTACRIRCPFITHYASLRGTKQSLQHEDTKTERHEEQSVAPNLNKVPNLVKVSAPSTRLQEIASLQERLSLANVAVLARNEAISSPDTEREGTKAERHEEKRNADDADEHVIFVTEGFTASETLSKTCKSRKFCNSVKSNHASILQTAQNIKNCAIK